MLTDIFTKLLMVGIAFQLSYFNLQHPSDVLDLLIQIKDGQET